MKGHQPKETPSLPLPLSRKAREDLCPHLPSLGGGGAGKINRLKLLAEDWYWVTHDIRM